MSNDIRNSLGDLGPDTQAAQEAKKKAFPIAYIREGRSEERRVGKECPV